MNLFFEPSTRTRTSFEVAEKRLSADTLSIAVAHLDFEKPLVELEQRIRELRVYGVRDAGFDGELRRLERAADLAGQVHGQHGLSPLGGADLGLLRAIAGAAPRNRGRRRCCRRAPAPTDPAPRTRAL